MRGTADLNRHAPLPAASSAAGPATGLGCAAVGVEARLREVEQRLAAANGLDVRERWADVVSPAVRVRVLDSGTGDPVLFINGISAPGIGMAALAGRLPGHRVLLVDLPGHGLSPPYLWHGAPLREQAVNIIAGVLDGLGIDQVTLVGNALGGMFSLWFALDRPKRVARVVLVGLPGGAIAGARGDLPMGMFTAPALGRVATWMARLPMPRSVVRMGLRPTVRADTARSLSDDIVDLHLLSMRIPGRPRRIDRCCGASSSVAHPAPSSSSPTPSWPASRCRSCSYGAKTTSSSRPLPANRPSTRSRPLVSSRPRAASSPGTTTPTAAPPSSLKACSRRTRLSSMHVGCGGCRDAAYPGTSPKLSPVEPDSGALGGRDDTRWNDRRTQARSSDLERSPWTFVKCLITRRIGGEHAGVGCGTAPRSISRGSRVPVPQVQDDYGSCGGAGR